MLILRLEDSLIKFQGDFVRNKKYLTMTERFEIPINQF
jgi:hypothetical protein